MEDVYGKNCNIKKSMQEIWKAMRVGCDGSRVCERNRYTVLSARMEQGSTTMFKLLAGLIQPTSGDMTFFEGRKTPQEARKKISFMIENPYLDLGMTAAQNMNMLAILYDARTEKCGKVS